MTDHDPRPTWTHHTAPLDPYGPSHAYLPPAYLPPAYGPAPGKTPRPGPAPDDRRLAITGIVLGGLALLGVLLLGIYAMTSTFVGSDGDGGSGGSTPIRGTIGPAAGTGLDGSALAAEISRQVRDDGGDPEGVTCPDTAKVDQDVTTVCHGNVDGAEYAFVVFFEDARGDYTLLPV